MSIKHLSTGSTDRPIVPGKLRLYSMRFCPYSQRVHLVLDSKNIPYDTVYINLTSKPEWYTDKLPSGKVPALVIDGEYLYESLIISDFLDDEFPQHPLWPKDSLKKAKDKIFIESFNKVISLFYKIFLSPILEKEPLDEALNGLDEFERELVKRSTPFFGGEKPGMADYMIWPWLERIEMVKLLGFEQFKIPRERFMRLVEWTKAMLEDEGVKKSYLPGEIHAKYLKGRRAGAPDYDNIL